MYVFIHATVVLYMHIGTGKGYVLEMSPLMGDNKSPPSILNSGIVSDIPSFL